MSVHRRASISTQAAAIVATLLCAATTCPAQSTGSDGSTAALAQSIRQRAEHALDRLDADGDFTEARQTLDALLLEVAAYAPTDDKALYAEVACARRLVLQFDRLELTDRLDRLRQIRRQPELARALAFNVDLQQDKLKPLYELLQRLRTAHRDAMAEHPNLATAICVVHDEPLARRINENRAIAPDPLAIFEYYIAHEDRMLFGVRDVPVELLVYVVDTTTGIDEMSWALERYAGDQNVGARFFDIAYDFEHLREAAPKKSTVAGWNLPNILKFGGVCADQAYFAVQVGKAIGVPTTYTVGRSGDVSHAWVGFLQAGHGRAWWNFNTGRYDAYQGVRGVVLNPQTRRHIPDSTVSLLADLIHASELDRHFAASATDAARLLGACANGDAAWPPPAPVDGTKLQRGGSVDDQLDLLEAALRACPGYAPAWFAVRDLAQSGALTLDHKKKWASVLHRLCAQRYPDFEMAILEPMITSVDDVREQNALWNAAFATMAGRADLAAEIRMAQAEMWLHAGQPRQAGQCYEDVIRRYANAGPFIVTALRKAEQILIEHGEQRRVAALYAQAWARIDRPNDMAGPFTRQSNWYRVGRMYADRLDKAGMPRQAEDVRNALRRP